MSKTSLEISLQNKFIQLFNNTPLSINAPGRINLIGEHTDYNDGFVLPAAIEDGNDNDVSVGRISGAVALVIAVLVAPMLGSIDQAFQYIQEYTGLVSPVILAVFMMGLFYKKATNKGAIVGILVSIPVALALKATSL